MLNPKFVRVVFADGDTYFAFWDDEFIHFGESDRELFKFVDEWEEAAAYDLGVSGGDPDDPDAPIVEGEMQEVCRKQIPVDWPRRNTEYPE